MKPLKIYPSLKQADDYIVRFHSKIQSRLSKTLGRNFTLTPVQAKSVFEYPRDLRNYLRQKGKFRFPGLDELVAINADTLNHTLYHNHAVYIPEAWYSQSNEAKALTISHEFGHSIWDDVGGDSYWDVGFFQKMKFLQFSEGFAVFLSKQLFSDLLPGSQGDLKKQPLSNVGRPSQNKVYRRGYSRIKDLFDSLEYKHDYDTALRNLFKIPINWRNL